MLIGTKGCLEPLRGTDGVLRLGKFLRLAKPLEDSLVLSVQVLELFLEEVLTTGAYLETYNQGRMEEIQLSEENGRFLNAVSTIREQNLTEEQALALLSVLLDG